MLFPCGRSWTKVPWVACALVVSALFADGEGGAEEIVQTRKDPNVVMKKTVLDLDTAIKMLQQRGVEVTLGQEEGQQTIKHINIKVDPKTTKVVLPSRYRQSAAKVSNSAATPNNNNSKPERDISRAQKIDRVALYRLFHAIGTPELQNQGKWKSNRHVCKWFGITCGALDVHDTELGIPDQSVTKIELKHLGLSGTLPTELAAISFLTELNLDNNTIVGTIPTEIAKMKKLRNLILVNNQLSGTVPEAIGRMRLDGFQVAGNMLVGNVLPQDISGWVYNLTDLDLHNNNITGTIPKSIGKLTKLKYLVLADNQLGGKIPLSLVQLSQLSIVDLSRSGLSGTIPEGISALRDLNYLALAGNKLQGEFPTELWKLESLMHLVLSDNEFNGRLPPSSENNGWFRWSLLSTLYLDHNKFSGPIPGDFFVGIHDQIRTLDLSYNNFSGTIPDEVGKLLRLTRLEAMSNKFTGSLPPSMLNLNMNLRLNFTNNLLTGDIPSMFCGVGFDNINLLYGTFGCDAVLCPKGTFHDYGHATLHSGCRACPHFDPEFFHVLGRTKCDGVSIIHGDANGDGELSDREIVRLIYLDTLGRFWGEHFQSWADLSQHECLLTGITCDNYGNVMEVNLSDANLCSNGDRKAGPPQFCLGLPTEIGLLSSLRTLNFSRRQFLRGSIPSEIGRLSKLTSLDFTSCTVMTGKIPSEIGQLTNLIWFKTMHSGFTGKIPSEVFRLEKLEHLGLASNKLTGSIPTDMNLPNLKDFMLSRNDLTGTVPTEIGLLTSLVNFEVYGSQIHGTIPSEFAKLPGLKRMDFFNCYMSGKLPESFPLTLQILNIKGNAVTGTIPNNIGELHDIFWVDLSDNRLHGTIPPSFGTSKSIKDLRLSNNMIYDPIPRGLCANEKVNHGGAKAYGCDGILCAHSTYNEYGFATQTVPCRPCPEGTLTVYRGSSECEEAVQKEVLKMMYQLMEGDITWPSDLQRNWGRKDKDICEWAGISCDEDGDTVAITIPLLGNGVPS